MAFFITGAAHAYLEENESLLIAAVLMGGLLCWWNSKSVATALLAVLLMVCAVVLGSPVAPFVILLVFWSFGAVRAGVVGALTILIAGYAYSPLVAALSESTYPILATLSSISLAFAPLALLFVLQRAWRPLIFGLFFALAEVGLVLVALWGEWIGSGFLDATLYRTLLALVPGLAALWCSRTATSEQSYSRRFVVSAAAMIAAPILILPWSLPTYPIDRVVFDEAHGDWATTLKTYGPNDFGRDHSYTYRLLADYSKRLVPGTTTYAGGKLELANRDVFILKMPITTPSEEFKQQLTAWVREGGRLLVVLDHTDLFDTTQNANSILQDLAGITVGARAVFAADGRPNAIGPTLGKPLRAHALGVQQRFQFQTGTSFTSIPIHYVPLGTHGPSYSEAAEYYRPNRFGYFTSDPNTPFANHLAAVVTPVGKGLVLVLTDSTPWSNFVMFRGAYRDAYRNVIGVLQRTEAIRAYGYVLAAAALVLVMLLIARSSALVLTGALLIGLIIGCSISTSQDAWARAKAGRDFNLHVSVGTSATTEALAQLVPPGTNNYARLLSGIQKFGLVPRLDLGSAVGRPLEPRMPVLLIEPSLRDLPDPEDLLERVHAGSRVVILFRTEQVGMPGLQEWLERLRLRILPIRSLARAEAPDLRLEERTEPALIRHLTFRISALSESRLWEQEQDAFTQSFAVRPIQHDVSRPIGSLVLSFQAEQFSDNAVGDIWEGKLTTALARDREKRVATLFGYSDMLSRRDIRSTKIGVDLPHYTVLRDGAVLLEGSLPQPAYVAGDQLMSLGLQPDEYVAALQRKAVAFIRTHCMPGKTCETSLIGDDLVEWHVFFRTVEHRLVAVELIHDRRFGSLGSSYHVLLTAQK